MVAELLIERHLEFIWGGRLGQFLRWVRWLPAELLVQHPVLPAAGGFGRRVAPDARRSRLSGFWRSRSARALERPQLWSPYLEAGVQLIRSGVIERGDVGAAVDHARRAVAAAQEGAEVLSVGALASLAQALFFAGELDDTRRVGAQAVERPDAPNVTNVYVGSLGLLALVDAEQGRTESAEAWARQAIGLRAPALPGGLVGRITGASGAGARRGLRPGTSTRPSARRYAGERLRRSPQPTVGHAHALLVLAQVRLARSRLARAEGDLERAKRAIAGFPDPGRLRRSPRRSSRPSSRLEPTLAATCLSKSPVRPSSPCCEGSQPACRDARSPRSCTSRSTPSRARRASCTASSVRPRKRRRSPAPKRSACLSHVNHPGDPPADAVHIAGDAGHPEACMSPIRYRLVVKGESGAPNRPNLKNRDRRPALRPRDGRYFSVASTMTGCGQLQPRTCTAAVDRSPGVVAAKPVASVLITGENARRGGAFCPRGSSTSDRGRSSLRVRARRVIRSGFFSGVGRLNGW